jgi:hypothetical protein
MHPTIWAVANLTPEQERLLKEAEATLGGGVLVALKGREVNPSELTASQLACVQGLEQRLGLVVVALQSG